MFVDEIYLNNFRNYESGYTKFSQSINVIYGDCVLGKRKPGLILDNSKLKELGWILSTSINDGIAKTFDSLNFRSV